MNLLYRRNIMYTQQIYFLWLTKAAMQTILAAFGQRDGKAVINATNAYLNQLAASGQAGKDKATALAGFINEDPMMVCSLGLEVEGVTVPIRWLVGDGNSWIDSGYNPNQNTQVEAIFKLESAGGNEFLYGVNATPTGISKSFMLQLYSDGKMYVQYNNEDKASNKSTIGVHKVFHDKYKVYYDDVDVITFNNATFNSDYPLYLMARMRGGIVQNSTNAWDKYFIISESNTSHKHFIPFVSPTRDGMVDLVAGVFHPNQGTGHFTDAYTLQDGVTPWTPGTPI